MHEHLSRALEYLAEALALVEAGGLATMPDRVHWTRLMEDAEDEMEMAKGCVPWMSKAER
jgi:hypothetical protein